LESLENKAKDNVETTISILNGILMPTKSVVGELTMVRNHPPQHLITTTQLYILVTGKPLQVATSIQIGNTLKDVDLIMKDMKSLLKRAQTSSLYYLDHNFYEAIESLVTSPKLVESRVPHNCKVI
jgi:hypothetical protein